jgi:peptidoglycan/LPS O-acetylase OafA/YrhL
LKAAIREDIQGLRALAVILVILSHLPAPLTLAGGFVGVDIFFVISGFVITRVLVRPRGDGDGRGFFVGFMGRRVARLVPALLAVCVVAAAASVLFAPTTELRQIAAAGITAETFVSNFYYTLNFDTYWNPAVLRSPFLHTWSLGVEFQTYLVLPLLLLPSILAPADARGRRRALAIVVGGAAISLVLFVYLLVIRTAPLHGLDAHGVAFYAPVTRFWEFALGIVPALVVPATPREGRASRALATVAWLLIAAGVASSTVAKGLNLSVAACCVGVAVLLVQGERPGASRSLLASRPLVWIGDRSYSIYLWHWPLLVVCIWVFPGNTTAVLGAIAATFLLSAASYPLVEQRFRRARGPRWRAAAGWTLLVGSGAAAMAAAWSISSAPWYSSRRPITDVAMLFPGSIVSQGEVLHAMDDCHGTEHEIHCKFFPEGTPEVVIIGDSLAYRSIPAVALAAKQHGLNASMLYFGRCSIEQNSCQPFQYDYLKRTKLAGIIVTTNYDRASDRLNGTEIAYGARILCPPNVRTQDCPLHQKNVDKYLVDAAAGLKQLEGFADHILVALPFPQQAKLVPQCLSLPPYFRFVAPAYDGEGCGRTSLGWQRARQGLYPSAMRKVTAGDAKVMVWDPTEYLCHDGWCPAVINLGEKIMDDGIHWTWPASRYLYPAFSKFLDGYAASSVQQ